MDLLNLDLGTVFAWGVAGVWIVAIVTFLCACRNRSVLRPLGSEVDLSENPRLSVIVAARNETDCIETCLRSLLRQDYSDLEVIAVNDRSTDDTGEILDRLALEFADRLRVIHVAALPAGWFGKPHALTAGLERATGSLVCFTDADCEFQSPAALLTTVAELIRRDLDFFSVAARYTMTSLRESVAVPCCTEALLVWLRPEHVDDPNKPDVFANGAFILARREPFEQIGGWGAVRTQISEDLQIARLAKSCGLRLGVAQAEGLYQTRSYRSTRESWNGWSRIFKGTLTPAQLVRTLARMCLMFALPLGAVLWGLSDAVCTGSFEWLTRGAGLGFAIAFALRCVLDVAVFRLVGSPVSAILLAPLGRLFVMAAATRALLSHAGLVHTHWRGSTFSAGQLVMPLQSQPELQIPATRAAPAAVPTVTA
jgi:cellulose synthase/poly-beta-1,6-N-acetylglucosamine synthase-like glycosyltransferase